MISAKPIFVRVLLLSLAMFSFTLSAQTVTLDERAVSRYSESEVRDMPEYKIHQINFLYRNSFVIPEEMTQQVKADQIDISMYNRMRSKTDRTKVYLVNEGEIGSEKEAFSSAYIMLLSIDELQSEFERIEAEVKSGQSQSESK